MSTAVNPSSTAGLYLYNYTTGHTELANGASEYDEYLPPDLELQNLYALYRASGMPAMDAAIRVLELCSGRRP